MTILYEDNDLIVTVKPAGLLSVPKEGKKEDSALDRLSALLAARAEAAVPHPVHRLDRQTGGLMVFAKHAAAAAALSAAVAADGMQKEYLAVLEGTPAERQGRLCDLLYFDRQRDKTYVVTRARRGVHEARLAYEVLATRAGDGDCPQPLSLVRVRLETGRTHQIRAQFASRRLPLYGDARYGAKTRGSLGLFAAALSFPHPAHGKAMSFAATPEAGLPFSFFL